ncbi:hypothetical protein [Streptomyces sp. NPDC006012]
MDEALEETACPKRRRKRTRIGFRQVAVRVSYVLFWIAAVWGLLSGVLLR